MQLTSKYNNGARLLLNVIDITANMHELFHSKTKKVITITNVFQKILVETGCKQKRKYGQIKAMSFTIDQ